MSDYVPDLGARITVELTDIHQIFRTADEFYRLYREALLNNKANQAQPKPTEWIPLSDH